jgi:hypothetical protein
MRLSFYPSLDSEYDDNTEGLEKASGLGAEMELLIYLDVELNDRESEELRGASDKNLIHSTISSSRSCGTSLIPHSMILHAMIL